MNVCKCAVWLIASVLGAGAFAATDDFYVTGYAAFDVSSGYVYYGARANDEPCAWTFAEFDVGYGNLGSIGCWLWQSSDLTGNRHNIMRRMAEWDWSVFYRGVFDLAQDWRVILEVGHLWYSYGGVKPIQRKYYHTMEEWGGRLTLENPYLTPYFEGFYDYKVYDGVFFNGGIRHRFELPFSLSLTPDLVVGGGNRNFYSCLYPPYDGSVAGGISYMQLMATLRYAISGNFGIHASLGYVSLIGGDLRDAVERAHSSVDNDFLWGMIGVDFAF